MGYLYVGYTTKGTMPCLQLPLNDTDREEIKKKLEEIGGSILTSPVYTHQKNQK